MGLLFNIILTVAGIAFVIGTTIFFGKLIWRLVKKFHVLLFISGNIVLVTFVLGELHEWYESSHGNIIVLFAFLAFVIADIALCVFFVKMRKRVKRKMQEQMYAPQTEPRKWEAPEPEPEPVFRETQTYNEEEPEQRHGTRDYYDPAEITYLDNPEKLEEYRKNKAKNEAKIRFYKSKYPKLFE